MPTIETSNESQLYYTIDDYTEPWKSDGVENVLLLHGMAESHKAWFAWIPHLAREYRVIRADLPGLGRSSIDLPLYDWSLGRVVHDLNRLLDELGIQRVHVVGAKIGGSVALKFAAAFPQRVASVTSMGGPIWPKGSIGTNVVKTVSLAPTIREMGVSRWARDTMGLRLGPDADPAQVQWWINLMSTSDADVCVKATTHVADADLRADLALIEAPALLLTSSISGLAGEEAAEVWSSVARGQREIIECSGYHISAVLPDECARRVLRFLREHPVD